MVSIEGEGMGSPLLLAGTRYNIVGGSGIPSPPSRYLLQYSGRGWDPLLLAGTCYNIMGGAGIPFS